jgi:hypothetical protein
LFFGEIAIHAFSFFTYPCKLQERETTLTKLEKKILALKNIYHETANIFKKTRKWWDLDH